MAKRFTDSDRWKNQAWLKKLHPFYKLAWVYITDECDHAGIWKIDVVDLKEYTTIPDFDLLDFVKQCNKDYDKLTGQEITKERIRIIDRKYLWITGFMEFQYGGKSGDLPKNNIVTSAIDILKSMSLLNEALNKGFINPSSTLQEHLAKGKERVKDKDKDKGSNKGLNKKDKNEKYTIESRKKWDEEQPVDYDSFVDFWNEYHDTNIQLTDNKKNDIEKQLKHFTGYQIQKAIYHRKIALKDSEYLTSWESLFTRKIERMEKYLNLEVENARRNRQSVPKTRGDKQKEQFFWEEESS